MSERYSSLFRLPENLYSEGAPVLIAAGALLKDNQTGNIIAQLKLKNIGEKHIKAVKVAIFPMDSVNRPLGDTIVYDYLDLDIKRDEDFGQKNPIRLSDASTRAYAAKVAEVSFADNTVWSASDAPWEVLSSQDSLSAAFQDAELVKQFQLEYGNHAIMQPKQDRDLWLCYCGAVNRRDETICHVCGGDPNFDFEAISEKKNRRLAEEKAEAERKAAEERAAAERRAAEAAAAKAAAEAKAKKTKKTLAIVIPSVAVVAAVVLLLTLVVIPSKKYNDALALGDAGQYEQAIAAFDAMGGYKDSAAQSERLKTERENAVNYAVAETLLDAKDYDAAIERFRALGDYRDSAQRAEETMELKRRAQYDEAKELLSAEDYDGAIALFKELGNYQDSATCLENTEELKRSHQYAEAETLLASNDFDGAIALFEALGNYQDCEQRIGEATELKYNALYTEALAYEEQGEYGVAISAFRKIVDYHDSKEHIISLVSKMQGCISNDTFCIIGLHRDGTVSYTGSFDTATGRQYKIGDFSKWKDIVAVSCGVYDLGLRSDGKIEIVGNELYSKAMPTVSSWQNITAISSSSSHVVGLRANGTVALAKVKEEYKNIGDVSGWSNIVAIAAGEGSTVGLKADGTVLAGGDNYFGQCNVSGWKNIKSISAGNDHTIGLRENGTVIATGRNEYGQCNVNGWSDIIAISAGESCSMGLKLDGTVVVAGDRKFNLSEFHDIVAFSASTNCLVGLRADGEVVVTCSEGWDYLDFSSTSNWTDIGRKG